MKIEAEFLKNLGKTMAVATRVGHHGDQKAFDRYMRS